MLSYEQVYLFLNIISSFDATLLCEVKVNVIKKLNASNLMLLHVFIIKLASYHVLSAVD